MSVEVTISNTVVELIFAESHIAGYGHYDVEVSLGYKGHEKSFVKRTRNTEAIDHAKRELTEDSNSLYIAFFRAIETEIEARVHDWLVAVEKKLVAEELENNFRVENMHGVPTQINTEKVEKTLNSWTADEIELIIDPVFQDSEHQQDLENEGYSEIRAKAKDLVADIASIMLESTELEEEELNNIAFNLES
jgi:hypothetical protein